MDDARAVIVAAQDEVQSNSKAVREIEQRLLAGAGPSSEVGQARARVDELREALDVELHRALDLPPHADKPTPAEYAREAGRLTPAQRNVLSKDKGFRKALQRLGVATGDVDRAQKALFEKDPAWVAATEAARKASRAGAGAKKDAERAAGLGSLSPKRQLRGAQALAAQARAVIAMGQAALRSLGATPAAGQETRPSSGSSSNR